MEKRILVNGSPYAYKSPMSAYELIEYLGFNINLILLDYNGLILQKDLESGFPSILKSRSILKLITHDLLL